MTATRPLTAALLAALLLPGFAPAAEDYMPPAQVRVHHEGSPAELLAMLEEAHGHVVARGKGWFDAILPQDVALSGEAFHGMAGGDRVEILFENADTQLERFRGKADAGDYHTFAEVNAEIDALISARPDLISAEVLGETFEGRPLRAVRISSKDDVADLPTFMIVGMHHAREWISVEVPMGLIHLLVEQYDSDPEIRELVDTREIWVLPVLNPDGLEYSQTEYKMWRKNRRRNEGGSYGVDLNRNWGYMWGHAGASTNPRSDTYRGEEAFSEPELQALRALALRERPAAAMSFHSYSELVLWPWGYGYDTPPDEDVLAKHGRAMAALNGYTPQQSADLYPASGDFDDWFYGTLGAISYTFELGTQFVPPESEIPEIVSKNLAALRYYLKNCADPFPLMNHSPLTATTDVEGPYPVELTLGNRYQGGDDPVADATLYYSSASSAATTSTTLAAGEAGSYRAEIPGDGYGTVEYHVEVTEQGGKTHRYPATGTYRFQVVEQLYLLVDDDDGKTYEDAYEVALRAADVPFTTVDSASLTEADLLGASGVVWFTGEDSSKSLTAAEQATLQAYLDAGGELALFGQDIGYDIKNSDFYKQTLRARFEKDKSNEDAVVGAAGSFLEGVDITLNGADGIAQKYPEVVSARDGGQVLASYASDRGDAAIAADAGTYRTAYFGFGLEGIDGPAKRAEVLGKTLAWLGEASAERRLRRAARLRELGGADAHPAALARLEASVLDTVRELGTRRDTAAFEALLAAAPASSQRLLIRVFRQGLAR